MNRAGEAVLAGAGGAALGALAASPLGAGPVGAAVGAGNGVIGGWAGIYDWARPAGWTGFVLDSSWGLVGTAGALAVHGLQLLAPRRDYQTDLSQRRGYHVYGTGPFIKRGFAWTVGNVVSNAGGRVGLEGRSARSVRRRRMVEVHERAHVWQSRWFGPVFPVLYLGWMAGGAVIGTLAWLRHRSGWYRLVETAAYYDNPFEVWAYRRDGHWPPGSADPRLLWGSRR